MTGDATPSYVIISGGTGANSIASAFGNDPAFVLPVSDDGGSSSEILRCFGGPSIGDIRSRLTRLIPLTDDPRSKEHKERQAIFDLMSYRFPSDASEKIVREIWGEIVEGRSSLWDDIGDDKKECIRAFLVHFNALTLKRAHKRFSFRNFSLGNGFLTGARDLFGSLPSAIFLFKSVASVSPTSHVIPAINTNQTVTIAAHLENGETIVGQCAISHPTEALSIPAVQMLGGIKGGIPVGRSSSVRKSHFRRDSRTFDTIPNVNKGKESMGNSPTLDQGGNIGYRKGEVEIPLHSEIERVFYINLYGQEIYPTPNKDYVDVLQKRSVLVYSCGSLWTSIIPCLALNGVAAAIAGSTSLKAKVILLNSKNDRETPDYKASDYIFAILSTLNRSDDATDEESQGLEYQANKLVTHLVYLQGCQIEIDQDQITSMGVEIIMVSSDIHQAAAEVIPMYSPESVEWAMNQISRSTK